MIYLWYHSIGNFYRKEGKIMNFEFANRVQDLHGSAIREAFKALSKPGMTSFAGGMPAPEMFPNVELAKIADDILMNRSNIALQYGITEGYAPLIEQVRNRLSKIGVGKDGDQTIIVTGGQQGIELVTKALINENDGVACENPSFVGGLNAFRSYNAKLYGVDMESDGMNINMLDDVLTKNKNIKFVYTIPTFQNPTGITMSLAKRKQLLEVAKKHNIFILEDNPYGELRFAGEDIPTIKSMDTDNRVIYVGSFSKILSPGLRLGFLCADETLIEKVVVCKQVSDVHTNIFAQMLASEYLSKYDIDEQIKKSKALYGAKCKLMKECIEEYFPKNVTSTSPQGGIFLWCDMNNGVDSKIISAKVLGCNVAIVPGAGAMPNPNVVTSAFRLNYSTAADDKIVQGISALGEVLSEYGK